MKFTLVFAASAIASTSGESIRQHLRQAALSELNNDPICYDILDQWWEAREAEKTRGDVTSLDATCATFDNEPDQCRNKNSRSTISSDDPAKNAACTMVGAHDKRCIGNPCNHLNTGDCTVQATGGVCLWYTKDQVTTNNNYWNNMAKQAKAEGDTAKAEEYESRTLPGHGCYRNPCNQAGFGKSPSKDCNSGEYNVPGLITCTWCKGAGDPLLKGKGMGCQLTNVNTNAQCAPVNNDSVPKDTVFENVNNNQCQCSNAYPTCETIITGRAGDYKPRYG